jgi:phytoene synthase
MHASLPDRAPAAGAELAACRAALRDGSGTFLAASLLLSRRVRDPATALYAFCRMADDEIDRAGGAVDAVAQLRDRLARAYDGRPFPVAADRALAEVVARFAIPRALPEALLEGFAWDAAGRRYETLSDLIAYATRVAGTVGAMMAILMGRREADVVARACDLGIAMQLTNIARDVGEDARAGRLYLPLRWMREAGIDPDAWMAEPRFSPALGGAVQRLLSAAESLYERSDAGIARLPRACRPGIRAARTLYAEIGREVERRGLDSVSARAVVPAGRKVWLLARSLGAPSRREQQAGAPPLEQARFLVEAVAVSSPTQTIRPTRSATRWWDVAGRLMWLVDLFERLEREPVGRVGS